MKVQFAAFYAILFSVVCSFSEKFLGISGGLFMILFVVMITDYITGLKASKKEGKKFCSKRGLEWVFKLGSYLVFLGVSFLIRKELIAYDLGMMEMPFKVIHFYILIHIFWWETKSIDENFERLGYSFRILKLFDSLFEVIKGLFKKKIDETTV